MLDARGGDQAALRCGRCGAEPTVTTEDACLKAVGLHTDARRVGPPEPHSRPPGRRRRGRHGRCRRCPGVARCRWCARPAGR
ncbi:hypothetical protein [Streptomyces sp. NPDC020951]|uniref:hypothetical protein n=1 Tax=Streptomyces sp. NPDC020951 TaxID=3365104 RepID=UPI003795EDB6